jgi:hypothetical protein
MKREEAYEKMRGGEKVTHTHFTDDEYLEYKDDEIKTEGGFDFSDQFWSLDILKDGWSLYS